MPVQPTYPGVYIEEVSSGVRTITGVATSITAFIGRTLSGPENEPTIVNSFGDFERIFGGLWVDSTPSYSVRDFYLNGGSQAVIVRVTHGAVAAQVNLPTAPGSPPGPGDNLLLRATSPGAWANTLSVSIDYLTQDPTMAITSPPTPPDPNLFNLTIYQGKVVAEVYKNVSLNAADVLYLPRVLDQSSVLLEVTKDGPNNTGNWVVPAGRPAETGAVHAPLAGGDDGGVPDLTDYTGTQNDKTGLYALLSVDLFNLLCIPPPTRSGNTPVGLYPVALSICKLKRAVLLVDPPFSWGEIASQAAANAIKGLNTLNISGPDASYAALYYPRVVEGDPLRKGQPDTFVACGAIAGVIAATDTSRGVWKSPAGIDAALNGVQGLQAKLNDAENGQLNPLGINCLRTFPLTGNVIWGARTLRGADLFADEYKYLAVRRTALFLEESLYRGTQWVVFEPNDEPLWAQIRLNVGAFMHNLFRQGAFQGTTPKDAYLVKCDKETTTQNDINLGVVNILVAFAPLKPAEFVMIQIQQLAGQIAQ